MYFLFVSKIISDVYLFIVVGFFIVFQILEVSFISTNKDLIVLSVSQLFQFTTFLLFFLFMISRVFEKLTSL